MGSLFAHRGVSELQVRVGVLLIIAMFSASQEAVGQTSGLDDEEIYTSPALTEDIATRKPEKKLKGSWALGIGGETYTDRTDESGIFSFQGWSFIDYQLHSTVKIHAEPRFVLATGQVQARFDQNQGQSRIGVDEAVAVWQPFSFLQLEGGGINQRRLNSPFLARDTAFAGIAESIVFGNPNYSLMLFAEQTVPTARSFNDDRQGKEPTPSLLVEMLKVQASPGKTLIFSGHAGHYRYNDLPAKVAFESSLLGNSVDDAFPTSAKFNHDFEGLFGGLGACLCFGRLNIRAGGQIVENTQAPSGASRGQISYLEFDADFKSVVVTPRLELFFNESDTAPAYYNSGFYGHNNRQGQAGVLTVNFPKAGFKLKSKFSQAELINPNANQSDAASFSLYLETHHESF